MNVNNYNSLSSSILQIVNPALSILHLPKSRCPQMRFISAELKIEEGPFLRKGRCSAVVRVPESRNKKGLSSSRLRPSAAITALFLGLDFALCLLKRMDSYIGR